MENDNEKKCYRKVKIKCPQPDPNNPDKECFKKVLTPCQKRKRCQEGKLARPTKDGREICKDDSRYGN